MKQQLMRKDNLTYAFLNVDINECASSPCRNGGACNDHVNSYTCTCSQEYSGTHCELGICSIYAIILHNLCMFFA